MKTVLKAAALAGVVALAACNSPAVENAADNVEANAEAQADSMDAMAENTTNGTAEDMMENQADAMRENGDEAADNIRETENAMAGNDTTDR